MAVTTFSNRHRPFGRPRGWKSRSGRRREEHDRRFRRPRGGSDLLQALVTGGQTVPERPRTAFDRLHATLQEALYRMRWTKLRQIQVDAIHEVFDGSKDLIIAAKTAAWKTEAAFLPIFSQIVEKPDRGIRVIYVGPLKALINDQFSRLELLCKEAEIPVHKWHGDVSRSAKKKLLEGPAGVLLITPESIESLFVNHPHELTKLFAKLGYIVIDELHSFIGTERGAHLKSLICRLVSKGHGEVRLLGLSDKISVQRVAERPKR